MTQPCFSMGLTNTDNVITLTNSCFFIPAGTYTYTLTSPFDTSPIVSATCSASMLPTFAR